MDFNNDERENKNQPDNQTNDEHRQETRQDPFYNEQSDSDKGPGLTKPINQKQGKQKRSKQPRTKSSHALLSGLLGGIISAVIVAGLFLTNIIPTDIAGNSSGESSGNDTASHQESTPAVSNTAASDDSSVATDISETSKAVVGVVNKQKANPWEEDSEDAGSGSGIIYKKEDGKAYVVTNNHVVSGAEEVDITLEDDETKKAKVLGTDELTDLAVLQVDGDGIDTIAKLGKSGDLDVGESVIAIGNPLGKEFSGSVTKGIVSGLDRNVDVDTSGNNQPDWSTEVIQTDAAINPGNSGGALVNDDGEVIGINSMKIAQQAVEGIGFAIPIDAAQPIMEQLENDGKIERPFIGISTASLDEVPPQYQQKINLPDDVENGMVVADIEPGSPADDAGLDQFDVITKIDGHEIDSMLDLRKYMYNETKIGDKVELEVYQNGKPEKVKLKLTKREETSEQ